MEGDFYHIKTDIFNGIMTFSSSPNSNANLTSIPVSRVNEIISINKKGEKVPSLTQKESDKTGIDYKNVVGQDSLTRFDKDKRKKNGRNKGNKNNGKIGKNNKNADENKGNNDNKESRKNDKKKNNSQQNRKNAPENINNNKSS